MTEKLIIAVLAGYLLGAIPIGLILGKVTRRVDIREYGSGVIGAANVQRTLGTKIGAVALLGDLGKGAAAALVARHLVGSEVVAVGSWELGSPAAQAMASLAAIIGHNWSVYIKFMGGRGVSTFFGGWLIMYWPITLFCGIGITLGGTALTRYFSLGSILGIVSSFVVILPLVVLGRQPVEYLIYTIVAGALVLFRHRGNIRRLCSGTERKLGERADGVIKPS